MTRSIRLLLLAAALMAPTAAGSPSGGPTLRAVSTTHVGGSPSSLTTAAGDIWVSLGLDGVARLDGETGAVVARIEPGGAVIGLATGFGAVWAIDVFGDRLLRIDPETNTVTSETRVGGLPNGVTVGHGSVWVQNQLDSTVSRVDPGDRPRDGDDSVLPWRALAGRHPRHADRGLGRHGRRERRRPRSTRRRRASRGRSPSRGRGRSPSHVASSGSAVRMPARSSGSGAAGSRMSRRRAAGRTATARGWQVAASSGWRERTRSCGSGRSRGAALTRIRLRHISAVLAVAGEVWVTDQSAGRVVRFRNGRSQ